LTTAETAKEVSINPRGLRHSARTTVLKWRTIAYLLATAPLLLVIAAAWIYAHK